MSSPELLQAFLDSLKHPFLFCDLDHVVRYMNQAARQHYSRGADLLGTSVLACHNERSCEVIHQVLARMLEEDLDEELITDDERWRIYMRAVRGPGGELLGYYERYEPPRGQ